MISRSTLLGPSIADRSRKDGVVILPGSAWRREAEVPVTFPPSCRHRSHTGAKPEVHVVLCEQANQRSGSHGISNAEPWKAPPSIKTFITNKLHIHLEWMELW